MSLGVDIYRYQTVTDYRALASAVSYAWVKLTDGTGPAQVRGDKQVNGCKAAGIPVGGYHYAQPGNPVGQAAVFVGELRRLGAIDLAPALDMEAPFSPNATAKDFAIEFCWAVATLGYRPAVYMSASWAGALRPDQWGIPGLVIWLAAYGTNTGQRNTAALTKHYSGRYDVHQFTSVGRVTGISGNVDLNWAPAGAPLNHPAPQEDIVRNLILAQEKSSTKTWVGNGITRRHVADPKELEGLRYWIDLAGGDSTVHEGWEDLRVLGTEQAITTPVRLDDTDLTTLAGLVADKLTTLRFEPRPTA
jgi:GH25 family lysozyme M1 (1,4-beta-N-acetylmuramidase)